MSTSRTYTLTSDELQYLLNEAIVCYNARCGRAPATCSQILTVSQILDDLDAPKMSTEPPPVPDDQGDDCETHGPHEEEECPKCAAPQTREIPLSRGVAAIVDAADYDYLMQWKWYYVPGRYARRAIPWPDGPRRQRFILMHRVILNAPEGMQVDHINGNKLDNRRANLRLVTADQNQMNKSKIRRNGTATSQYIGVRWKKNRSRWEVNVNCNHKVYYIGRFTDEIEAAKAYDAAAQRIKGEYARLNFPTTDNDPQACAMPCDFPATHRVLTRYGGEMLLCSRHASIHNPALVLPLRTRIDEILDSVCTGCNAGVGESCQCPAAVAA